ncbi:MAG: preprotein translocase subunit SecY [Thermocladium sp.]|jgi:preprotein translocase subunit SecY
MSGRFIDRVEPLLRLVPTVPKPKVALSMSSRLLWTFLALTAYMVLSITPLYGVNEAQAAPLFNPLIAVIFASQSGTMAELGIGPIIIAGIIMELLAFSDIMNIDMEDPNDQMRFNAFTKLVAVIIAFGEGAIMIAAGQLGVISPGLAFIVWLQLVFGAVIVILLDDMVSKGWGLGSGISLFILISIIRTMFWDTFSPIIPPGQVLPLGVVPAIAVGSYIAAVDHTLAALASILYRIGYPSLIGLIATIVLGGLVLYVELMEVSIPMVLTQYGGYKISYPFKVMYVSVLPIIFTAYTVALIYNGLYFVATTYNAHAANPVLNALACVHQISLNGQLTTAPCTSSLLYFLQSTPLQLTPQFAVVHIVLYALLSIVYAYLWVNLAGMGAEDQAKTIAESGWHIPGFRSSTRVIARYLERYINALTLTSGLIAGIVAALGDILGVFGTGIGLILLVEIVIQYYSLAMQEQLFEMYPMLKRFAGKL